MDGYTPQRDPLEFGTNLKTTIAAAELSTDVFHRIFELSFSDSLPPPAVWSQSSFPAPHHTISRAPVERGDTSSWRVHRFGRTFFLSFSNPSKCTLKGTKSAMETHLHLSQNTPLICFVHLTGKYDTSLSKEFVDLLSKHQRRWRRVVLWLNIAEEIFSVPVPITYLTICDLGFLEELRLTFSSEYITSTVISKGGSPRHTMPLLARLDLEMLSDHIHKALCWLVLAPNIQEINISSARKYSIAYAPGRPYDDDDDEIPHHVHLANLQTMRIGWPTPEAHNKRNALAASILAHTTCPALTEFHLGLNSVGCDDVLYEFFLRSAPRLDVFHLHIDVRLRPLHTVWLIQPERIFDALTLVPTVRKFGAGWHESDRLEVFFRGPCKDS